MRLKRHATSAACIAILGTLASLESAIAGSSGPAVEVGNRVFPESVTSTRDGRLFVGSLGGRGILRAMPGDSAVSPWIAPGTAGLLDVLGVLADEKRNTLWACSADAAVGRVPAKVSALHAFDLATGRAKGRYELPSPGALCNDIAIAADGTVYVTDSINMEVARWTRGQRKLETWVARGAIGKAGDILDGIAILGTRVIVNAFMSGALYAIDATARVPRVSEIRLPRALTRPDGMRALSRDSLLVVESGDVSQLVQVRLKGNDGEILPLRDGFADGAVAVSREGRLAFVLEASLSARFTPGEAPAPSRIVPVALPVVLQ